MTANSVLGQRAIYALGHAVRSRLNGLYMATFFVGGAFGSAVGGRSYARGGWPLVMGGWAGPSPRRPCLLRNRNQGRYEMTAHPT